MKRLNAPRVMVSRVAAEAMPPKRVSRSTRKQTTENYAAEQLWGHSMSAVTGTSRAHPMRRSFARSQSVTRRCTASSGNASGRHPLTP